MPDLLERSVFRDHRPGPVELVIGTHSEDIVFDDAAPMDAPVDTANAEDSSLNSFGQDVYAESRDSDSEGQTKRGRKRRFPHERA